MAGNKSEVAVLCRIFNIINNLILYTYKYSNYKYYLKFITLVVEDTMVAREGGVEEEFREGMLERIKLDA